MRRWIWLVALAWLVVLPGCPVTQSQDTPVDAMRWTEPQSKRKFYLYVPSDYTPAETWPLVVTLHGTHGWDSSRAQIKEWKALAEEKGFIVAAPTLESVQGILPVMEDWWRDDLAADERAVLAIIDEIATTYRVDREAVLLTGFSAGGFPLYYIGLRNPDRFSMLIARACNSRVDLFESVELTDDARELPIVIFWGKSDFRVLQDQSWAAFRWLREHGFARTQRDELKGGHLRRPAIAYRWWEREALPERHLADRK